MSRISDFKKYMEGIVTGEMTEFLTNRGFFTAPAAAKHHSNYEGGLYDHSKAVSDYLVNLTEKLGLKWEREESPKIVGMFHDLCKMDNYYFKYGEVKFSENMLFKGHGDKSVLILSQMMKLTEEEVMCIRYHMGAFTDKEEWQYYSRAVHLYPNVLFTHTADMLASQVLGV